MPFMISKMNFLMPSMHLVHTKRKCKFSDWFPAIKFPGETHSKPWEALCGPNEMQCEPTYLLKLCCVPIIYKADIWLLEQKGKMGNWTCSQLFSLQLRFHQGWPKAFGCLRKRQDDALSPYTKCQWIQQNQGALLFLDCTSSLHPI